MTTRVSISEFARRRGISASAVREAILKGRIDKESDGRIDVQKADEAWEANTGFSLGIENTIDEGSKGSKVKNYAAVRTENEILKAEVTKIRIKQLNKELVEMDEVKNIFKTLVREFREAIQNWPARAANQIAGDLGTEPHTTTIILEKHIHKFLTEIAERKIEFKPSRKHIPSTG